MSEPAFHYASHAEAPNHCGAPIRLSQWIEEWAAVTCQACLATPDGRAYLEWAHVRRVHPTTPEPNDTRALRTLADDMRNWHTSGAGGQIALQVDRWVEQVDALVRQEQG